MANVTYLLGAGASSNALPTYQNFKNRFEIFTRCFNNSRAYSELSSEHRLAADRLYSKLKIFLKEFDFHNTPDTIAKKLYHIGNTSDGLDLKIVKQLLTLYFIYEQIVDVSDEKDLYKGEEKDIVEKRYDALVSGLLKPVENKLEMLGNFKILTWNYDLQFELTYARMSNKPVEIIQHEIQGYPKIKEVDLNSRIDNDNFAIVHLNGIAYNRIHGVGMQNFDYLGLKIKFGSFLTEYLLGVYKSMNTSPKEHEFESMFKFAWENLDENYSVRIQNNISKALEVALQTEVLVIIGYSFPIFNSAIDSYLLENMRTNLKKVYVQSPTANQIISLLKNSHLKWLDSSRFQDAGYTNPFIFPSEWNYDY